jgi:hypothetical protein
VDTSDRRAGDKSSPGKQAKPPVSSKDSSAMDFSLGACFESRAIHDRGTARLLNQMFGELASLSVRCQEGPSGVPRLGTKKKRRGKGG